ncbi:Tyrosine-protein kinase SPK-1 [Girardia tigrina] [Rhizoctonia solani]|uniref:Tyrosine-protein kinase SPK-1 [Girardia tigrina] n=1 Tax=Rhizoctonia solani TaxID=456999 RepID=A0A0K6G045_9AGAM|nr:Tyrosine-protein kinase SPK-1 [Girardia tigrina] [Rhizoctonia solani]
MAQTPPDTSAQVVLAESNSTISSLMTAAEILPLLSQHGCEDITSRLDTSEVGPAICMGGFGDVHCGALQKGDKVAVKCLRMLGLNDGDDKQLKLAAHELYVWSKCRHRNILELLGVANYNNQIAMVSPWMANGDLPRYLSKYPEADRYDLVADAVAYLKTENMVHGDIKGANILVSEDHIPKLTDFGTSALSKYTLAFTRGNGSQPGMSLRWTAPEIFVEGQANTFESDVYALGMTILEAFTGSVPYANLHDRAVMGRLMQKVPPERPEGCIGDKYGDALWILITSSWDTVPENRPTAQWVRNILTAIKEAIKADHEFELTVRKFNNRPRVEVLPPREPTYFTGAFETHAEFALLKEDFLLVGDLFEGIYFFLPLLITLGSSIRRSTSQEDKNETLEMVWKIMMQNCHLKSRKPATRIKEQGGWDQIGETLDRLLQESEEIATIIVDMDFKMRMILLPHYVTASFAENKRGLGNLFADLKKAATTAGHVAQQFAYISGIIAEFERSLGYYHGVSLQLCMGKIREAIQHINTETNDLAESIMKSKTEGIIRRQTRSFTI